MESTKGFQGSPYRDYEATAVSVGIMLALVRTCDLLRSRGVLDRNSSRKAVHILAGPVFLACWPLFSDDPRARYLAALAPGLNIPRLILLGTGLVNDPGTVAAMSRGGDRRELLGGPLAYVVVVVAATLLWWRCSPCGCTTIAVLCAGDGLADVVGRRYGGSNPLPWNRAKSWAGSVAFLLGGMATALLFAVAFCALGYFPCQAGHLVASVATVGVVAAAAESLPLNRVLDDNIYVPALAAALAAALMGEP